MYVYVLFAGNVLCPDVIVLALCHLFLTVRFTLACYLNIQRIYDVFV